VNYWLLSEFSPAGSGLPHLLHSPFCLRHFSLPLRHRPWKFDDAAGKLYARPLKFRHRPSKLRHVSSRIHERPLKFRQGNWKLRDQSLKIHHPPLKVSDRPWKVRHRPCKKNGQNSTFYRQVSKSVGQVSDNWTKPAISPAWLWNGCKSKTC